MLRRTWNIFISFSVIFPRIWGRNAKYIRGNVKGVG
jgi:hypothetical protein